MINVLHFRQLLDAIGSLCANLALPIVRWLAGHHCRE